MTRLTNLIVLVSIFLSLVSFRAEGKELSEAECKVLAVPSKGPAAVDGPAMLAALKELKTVEGAPALLWSTTLEKEVTETFDPVLVPTKGHQFFYFLHVLQAHLRPELPKITKMDVASTKKILWLTGMFEGSDVPDHVKSVTIDRTVTEDPRYVVRFDRDEVRLPLKGGAGYYSLTHGFCQHTTALVYYEDFRFSLRKLENGNLIARYFEGVDFFGTFGVRGMFNIDFNYVSILAVKFFHGSKTGEVTATMSPQEFKKNEHNALLRLVTKFAKNSSVQPLGW